MQGTQGGLSGYIEKLQRRAEELLEALHAFRALKWRPDSGHSPHPCGSHLLRHLYIGQAGEDRGLRIRDLSVSLGVKPPTVTAAVEALEARGLVERRPDPDDRRAVRIRLSEAGLSVVRERRKRILSELSGLVRRLGPEESRAFARALRVAAEYLAERGTELHPGCLGGSPGSGER